jgi:hypothetical protein
MISCQLCNSTFKNNAGGQLTNHLVQVHSMSFADYVVLIDFKGVEPRCACGLCDSRPEFSRGKFKTHAAFHKRFDVKERLFREKYGEPKCERCDSLTSFIRGVPRRWCSQTCAMVNKGFGDPIVQQKIHDVVKERYGVDNVFQRQDIIDAIAIKNKDRVYKPHTSKAKLAISLASKRNWANVDFKFKTSNAIRKAVNLPDERRRRSIMLSKKMQDPIFQKTMWAGHKNRLTKLHQRLRLQLNLDELGFVPEQRVENFWVDDLNEKAKIAIEFNGDYTHANPKKFGPHDIIRLRGQSYTAFEKWKSDFNKISKLENAGYTVIVVWESDDVDMIKSRLGDILIPHEAVTKTTT